MTGHQRPALPDASQALAQGRLKLAEAIVREFLDRSPDHPEALLLLGQILSAKGAFEAALHCLEAALRQGADPGSIAETRGGMAMARRQYDAALQQYEKALAIDPRSNKALNGAASACLKLNRISEARKHLIAARRAWPADRLFDLIEARILAAEGETARAEDACRRLLEAVPDHLDGLCECAVLLRRDGRPDEARPLLERALQISPGNPRVLFALANACYELGEFDAAESAFLAVLKIAPADVDTHLLLNRLYHDFGRTGQFGESFQIGLQTAPDSLPLRLAMIDTLTRVNQIERAIEALGAAVERLGPNPELDARAGRLAMARGEVDEAVEDMRAAAAGSPETPDFALALGEYLITQGDYEAALVELERIEPLVPDDQNLWALRGTAWQLGGYDEAAGWLFGDDAFVGTLGLDCPNGYDSLPSFLEDLRQVLDGLHRTRVAPIDQSLRHGTQTLGHLLGHRDPVIAKYKTALTTSVARYIAGLPDDEDHPLTRRKTAGFHFAGSWSVRLSRGGYHVDHIHPGGWISSACYIAFDADTVSEEQDDPAGWIRFGVPGIRLPGRTVEPLKIVKPEAGLLVLFPSYLWHGTYKVRNDGYRLTAPFDVVPD